MLNQIPDQAPAPPLPGKKRMSTGCIMALVLASVGAVIVGVIILMIALGAMRAMQDSAGIVKAAREDRVKSDIMTLSTALEAYSYGAKSYPTTEQGLEALINKPTAEPIPARWHRFLNETPTDGWKQPYRYRFPAQRSTKPFDVWSIGRDGMDGTADDIGNWDAPAR